VKEDTPGTNFGWAVDIAPSFGDKIDGAGLTVREEHSFSGALDIRHNLPTRTYFSASLKGSASPAFITPDLPGASVTGEGVVGQTIYLWGDGDLISNRDRIDLSARARYVHGWQELKTIDRSYSDSVVAVRGEFTNILWLYSRLEVVDRSQFRAGPRYRVGVEWNSIDSDRPDRIGEAWSYDALLGYNTRGGFGITATLRVLENDFDNPPLVGEPRKIEVTTGYLGVDFTKLVGGPSVLSAFEVGGEVSGVEREDGTDEMIVTARLKIRFGRRYAAD
jgi:hypothetical protein